MLAPCNASREHILADTLLRAANDGYDVSPLIECGADPMASGAPRPIVYPAGAAAGGRLGLSAATGAAQTHGGVRLARVVITLRCWQWARGVVVLRVPSLRFAALREWSKRATRKGLSGAQHLAAGALSLKSPEHPQTRCTRFHTKAARPIERSWQFRLMAILMARAGHRANFRPVVAATSAGLSTRSFCIAHCVAPDSSVCVCAYCTPYPATGNLKTSTGVSPSTMRQ